jgi:hypothetical protein
MPTRFYTCNVLINLNIVRSSLRRKRDIAEKTTYNHDGRENKIVLPIPRIEFHYIQTALEYTQTRADLEAAGGGGGGGGPLFLCDKKKKLK